MLFHMGNSAATYMCVFMYLCIYIFVYQLLPAELEEWKIQPGFKQNSYDITKNLLYMFFFSLNHWILTK